MSTRDIWVDFNGIDVNGCVTTLTEFTEHGAALSVGRRVIAGDDDGYTNSGTVVDIDGPLVTIQLDDA